MNELKSPEVQSGLSRIEELLTAANAVAVSTVVVDASQPIEDGFNTAFELVGEGLAQLEG